MNFRKQVITLIATSTLLAGCAGEPPFSVRSPEENYVAQLMSYENYYWTETEARISIEAAKAVCEAVRADMYEFTEVPAVMLDSGITDPDQGATFLVAAVQNFCPELEDELWDAADRLGG